mgnify:CR=1 FL=1
MIIQIRDDLFYKLVDLMENRSKSIYNELKEIKPLDTVATDTTLAKAREIKTKRIKQSIKETIQKLFSQDIQPTKYKIKWKLLIIEQTYWNSVAP